MTDPAGTVDEDCGCHRPDHESRSCDGGGWPPSACQPTTFGTGYLAPDRSIRQYLPPNPAETRVPDVGLCDMTDPAGTVEDDAVVTVPTTSPAPVMAVDSRRLRVTDYVWHGYLGRTGRYDNIYRRTRQNKGPGSRTLRYDRPCRDRRGRRGCHRPYHESRSCDGGGVAAVCVSPTTFGTATWAGPVDTTIFTAEPSKTRVPEVGLCDMTDPDGTVEDDAVVTVPTTSPAPVMAVVAAVCVSADYVWY